ncbi:MAG TPA: amidase [Rhizobiales bacterium]|nr:amidase [Hyphomicrobiales bacterium]
MTTANETGTPPIPKAGDICRTPAWRLAEQLRRRELSAREVVTAFLDRIDAVNPAVNAIISRRPREDVLAEADAADTALGTGRAIGPLHGLPIAIKDLAQTRGLRTTFGSPIFADFVPEEDCYHVERIRAAGALIVGKTNVPEFGFGSQTYNPVFGPTRNAIDPRLCAGGSSGGAAVALALDMLPIADGSDMGGSLRNPAAYNNIYGFRPSQGRVPAGPQLESFFAQMGVEGPMGRTVRDMALLLSVQAGYDPRAPLSLDGPAEYYPGLLDTGNRSLKVGWLGDLGGHLAMEDGILGLCEAALRQMEVSGWRTEPVLPDFDAESLWQAFVTLRHATSGAALGVHLLDPDRRRLLKPEAVFEAEGALELTAPKIYAAACVRTAWHKAVLGLFSRYDLLVLPTAQVFPFDIGTHWPAVVAGRRMDSYHRWMEVSAPATMAGCPAINVPVGFDSSGRPMGMQLIGPPRGDLATLQAAARYEEATPFGGGAGGRG